MKPIDDWGEEKLFEVRWHASKDLLSFIGSVMKWNVFQHVQAVNMRMTKRFRKKTEYSLELSSQSFTDIQYTNETSCSIPVFMTIK